MIVSFITAFNLGTETSGLNNNDTKKRILNALHLRNPFITVAWGSKLEAARGAYIFCRRMFTGACHESDDVLTTRLAMLFELFLNQYQLSNGEDPDDTLKANRIDLFLRKLSDQSNFTYEKRVKVLNPQNPEIIGSS